MTIVPVRLDDDEVRKLNILLKRGVYRSRNEAIRAILAEGLKERLGQDEDVTPLVNKLLALRRAGKNPLSFKTARSILDIVAEGRK